MTRRVLVFDSGFGGFSVVREIVAQLPDVEIVYIADDAAFPYGDWEEDALRTHIVDLMGDLIARYRPDAAVIACNTASTLVLADLRARHDVPFVGTVPAIKMAAERTESGLFSVLATPATVRRDYTFDLIAKFAPAAKVTLVGAAHLAALAEDRLAGRPVDMDRLKAEIAPCFAERDGGPHRYRRACLHALSVSRRSDGRGGPLAGDLPQPGRRDRAAGRGGAGCWER